VQVNKFARLAGVIAWNVGGNQVRRIASGTPDPIKTGHQIPLKMEGGL
jgi:hypothetical protein